MYENYIIDGNAVYEIDETCLRNQEPNHRLLRRKNREDVEDDKLEDMKILAEYEPEKLTIL